MEDTSVSLIDSFLSGLTWWKVAGFLVFAACFEWAVGKFLKWRDEEDEAEKQGK